ncbi:hypothetical protein G6F46_008071 [Rhizopus delemar]|uniref:Glycosyl transferase 64 domain-containing protein n=3 Tax=Rhizopus TaxID=4842 RepID=I1CIX5_RHIO9|nr:hypothetical protein RO3G_13116 [Rhizopus delemar RA 99-880]KAG1496706.1 hypothetical protein G6F53_012122 [Rhizopus delemar]KAG1539248.1 hypothetical protein G6F51_009257 [Rhizopus arrhizus]KAG1509143.1 hypothetical protein G6F52_011210 [Rhizopus delemar]KAG1561273.1 hypothetical protein G6F49_001949 [Rhizopus delemar]|eukprot:EIE88405.1 hypothetical protein RO3G_13116 [Rhizopus delemar RA 99-880]
MLTIQSTSQFISYYPLLCRFKHYPLHLVLLTRDGLNQQKVQRVFTESACEHADNVILHDLTNILDPLEQLDALFSDIQTKVLLQSDTPVHPTLKALIDKHQITHIALPEKEIIHALWIPDLSIGALQNWNKIDIKLVIITDRRPHSLSRLLQSAGKSKYLGDRVDLMIHMEQSADRATRMLVNSFVWKQGVKFLRHRVKKGGLMPAIVESWYPSHNDEYAVLLEDDIEVSPLFYVWSKYSILKYRYSGNKDAYRLMYGISLYAPRNLELVPSGRVSFDPNSVLLPAHYAPQTPYASQIPCSWGAVYFPEHWREFHAYLIRRLQDLNLPKHSEVRVISVPGSRSDKWKKSWKKYFIELVYLRAYVMLYPNFYDFEAFSTNHVEFGTHVKSEKRQSVIGTFMVPLMQRDTLLAQLPDHRLPFFEDLPVLDLWGQLQTHESLDAKASAYHAHVSSCPRKVGSFDPSDLFCLVDGPPDPPQVFPMSRKSPKPPVLVKEAVQPIEYKYRTDHTKEEEEQGKNTLVELGPKPIDVAQLSAVEDKSKGKDDELVDLENDLDTLNRIYYTLNPHHLDFLEDEKMDIEDEMEEMDGLEEEDVQIVEE